MAQALEAAELNCRNRASINEVLKPELYFERLPFHILFVHLTSFSAAKFLFRLSSRIRVLNRRLRILAGNRG